MVPYTIADYLATQKPGSRPKADRAEFTQAKENVALITSRLLAVKGKEPVSHFHKRLGQIMWQYCGMARNKEGLEKAIKEIPVVREAFWNNVNVPGSGLTLNQSLETAGRVADFLELGELMCRDALAREEKLRRTFPGGAPVSRRRVQARRRQLRPRGRLGVRRRRQGAGAQHRTPQL